MKRRSNFVFSFRSRQAGFSLVELLLALAVLLVLTTLAVPIVLRSVRAYQLNASASQLAGMLKFTKFEAIRENTPVNMQIVQQGTNWLVWVDSNGNAVPDPAEPEMLVGTGSFTLLPSGSVPSPAPIQATLGGGGSSLPWTVVSGSAGSVMYDQRGVCVTLDANGKPVTAASVYVLYLGSSTDATAGYRAILTLPSGAVQVWTSTSATTWQRIS